MNALKSSKLLTRTRGNPIFLARIIVFFLCILFLVVLYIIPSGWIPEKLSAAPTAILASALLATALYYFFSLVVRFLEAPALREIPKDFFEGIEKEVYKYVGYYRTNVEIWIFLEKQEAEERHKVKIVFHSYIYGRREFSYIGVPKFDPPKWAEFKPKPKYTINGHTVTKEYPIHKGDIKSERLEVCYLLESEMENFLDDRVFKDNHLWDSPVSGGFVIHFEFPEEFPEYECKVCIMKGSKKEPIYPSGKTKKFVHSGALFAHQGFSWSIEKEKK